MNRKLTDRISDDWAVKSIVYDNEISMQTDTGARCNVISQNMIKQMKIKTASKKAESKLQRTYHQTNRFNQTTLLFQ